MMKLFFFSSLFLIPAFALAGCTPAATAPTIPTSMLTPAITDTEPSTPTEMVRSLTTPSATITPTPFDTLEPAQATQTLQPLIKEPMNCVVPCFWGIVPGKTLLDEVRNFFGRLGFTHREDKGFYSAGYKPDSGGGFSAIFYTSGMLVENIEVTPYIAEQTKEGIPREWIAYSPETLIKQYGKPSRVAFAIDRGMKLWVGMIMYFDTVDLIIEYSGSDMSFNVCPLTDAFDFVRLWIGHNSPNAPSFETVPLEKATSLTMDQFTQLMLGNSDKACFKLKEEMFP